MTTTQDTEKERVLRAEQQALIHELECLELQRAAHQERLKAIRRELVEISKERDFETASK